MFWSIYFLNFYDKQLVIKSLLAENQEAYFFPSGFEFLVISATSKKVKMRYSNIRQITNTMAFSASKAIYTMATTEYKTSLKKVINILLRANLPMSFFASFNWYA